MYYITNVDYLVHVRDNERDERGVREVRKENRKWITKRSKLSCQKTIIILENQHDAVSCF